MDSQDGKSYQSANMLLDVIKDEYKLEDERGKKFDVRGEILMPLYTALLIFLITGFMSNGITGEKASGLLECVVYTIYVSVSIGSVLCILYAIWCLLKMFAISEYNRIAFKDAENEIEMTNEEYAVLLYFMYNDALNFNRSINDKKIVYLRNSMIMVKYIIGLIMLSYVFMIIIRSVERGVVG